MANEITEQEKQNGLQRIFQAVSQPAADFISGSARLLVYGTAVAAIAQIATGNAEAVNSFIAASPFLATFFAAVSGDILAGLIERVAFNDDLSDEDIQRLLVLALEESGLTQILSEQEFYRATRILEERRETEHQIVVYQLKEILSRLQQMPDEVDDAALEPYLRLVSRRTGRLLLGPLDPGGREKLHVDLEKVFININAGLQVLDQRSAPDPDKMIIEQYSAALAHIYYNRQLILLGDPGSGKSTLMRYLAHQLVRFELDPQPTQIDTLHWQQTQVIIDILSGDVGKLQQGFLRAGSDQTSEKIEKRWQGGNLVPVLVTLRDFARSNIDISAPTALWQFVKQRLVADEMETALPALKAKALRGEVIFLLDGVDEVPPRQRPTIWQAINALWESPYGENRWVVTCRGLSFSEDEAPPHVPVQTLQSLTDEQIDGFIEGWYGALRETGDLEPGEATSMIEQLISASRREKLHPLAENPMLLTIMALVQTYYGTLPDERAKLYKACVEVLLLRWQRRKEYGTPNLLKQLDTTKEKLEQLLWEIAWQAHSEVLEGQEIADISESEILHIARQPQHLGDPVKAAQFLEYTETRAHLLIARGGTDDRSYSFPHRTFQEYLAACYLASVRRFPIQAPKLAAQGDPWREVLNLAAGELVYNRQNWETVLLGLERMLPESTPDRDDQTCWLQIWLAGEMATVVGRNTMENDPDGLGQELLETLRNLLAQLLNVGALPTTQRASAGRILARLGDRRPEVTSIEDMQLCRVPAGPFIMGSGVDDKDTDIDEQPQHELNIPYEFWIGSYPVTDTQFQGFVLAGGYEEEDFWKEAKVHGLWKEGRISKYTHDFQEEELQRIVANNPTDFGTPFNLSNHPVVGVCWYEGLAFTRWLTQKLHAQGILPPEWRVRLPSEAEWEKAARGGLEIPQEPQIEALYELHVGESLSLLKNPLPQRKYTWGDEGLDTSRANYRDTRIGTTNSVGCFEKDCSPYGCGEMLGNVWEWTQSLWGEVEFVDEKLNWKTPFAKPYEADDGRESLDRGVLWPRVLRGGSWTTKAESLRCASRGGIFPSYVNYDFGFRLVVSPF